MFIIVKFFSMFDIWAIRYLHIDATSTHPVEFINTGIADIRIYTLINKDLSLGVNRRYSGNDQDFIRKRENRKKKQ